MKAPSFKGHRLGKAELWLICLAPEGIATRIFLREPNGTWKQTYLRSQEDWSEYAPVFLWSYRGNSIPMMQCPEKTKKDIEFLMDWARRYVYECHFLGYF